MGYPKYFETKGQKEGVGFTSLKIGLLSWLMSLSLSLSSFSLSVFLFEKNITTKKLWLRNIGQRSSV